MRIHHLNCISTCPLGGKLMDGQSRGLRGRLACHCLLVEARDQLVLVDTGLGLEDVRAPTPRLSRFFLALLRPELREEMTAVRQIERMGFDPRDVRHIVMTHLDFDHAGGLDDFPEARIHMLAREQTNAEAQRTILDRMRFRPAQWQLTRMNWHVYQSGEGEPWFGFDAVRHLDGVPPEILLVPLIGHTLGHCGVAVEADEKWMLLAGDAYFHHREMHPVRPYCTPGLRFYQWMMQKDARARRWNRERLRDLAASHEGRLDVICSHDVREFERFAGRRLDEPAMPVPRFDLGGAPTPVQA